MKTPFLVLGYQRSGTTLLRRLISMHPGLKYNIVHERADTLLKCKTKEEAYKKLRLTAAHGVSSPKSGLKSPYTSYKLAQQLCLKFKQLFGGFRLIHIIRNPIPTINSQVRTFNLDPSKCVQTYFESVPKMVSLVPKMESYQVRYEDLVENPYEQLSLLYDWMGTVVPLGHLAKVLTTKEIWKHGGRPMCGLKYFSCVQSTSPKMVLDKDIRKKIKTSFDKIPKKLWKTGTWNEGTSTL